MPDFTREFIKTGNGGSSVSIEVDIYNGKPGDKAIIIVHGADGKNFEKYRQTYIDLAVYLRERGFLAVLFAASGFPDANGEVRGVHTHTNMIEDIISILNHISKDVSAIGLFGRSAGSGISLEVARRDARVKSVAVWGCMPRIDKWYKEDNGEETFKKFFDERGNKVDRERFFDFMCNAEDIIGHVKQPVLLAGGSEDTTYVNAEEQYNMLCKGDSSAKRQMVIIKGAVHAMDKTNQAFSEYANLIADWFQITL